MPKDLPESFTLDSEEDVRLLVVRYFHELGFELDELSAEDAFTIYFGGSEQQIGAKEEQKPRTVRSDILLMRRFCAWRKFTKVGHYSALNGIPQLPILPLGATVLRVCLPHVEQFDLLRLQLLDLGFKGHDFAAAAKHSTPERIGCTLTSLIACVSRYAIALRNTVVSSRK